MTRSSSFFNEARPGSNPETEVEQARTRRVCKNAVEGGLCIAVLVGDSFGQPPDIFGLGRAFIFGPANAPVAFPVATIAPLDGSDAAAYEVWTR